MTVTTTELWEEHRQRIGRTAHLPPTVAGYIVYPVSDGGFGAAIATSAKEPVLLRLGRGGRRLGHRGQEIVVGYAARLPDGARHGSPSVLAGPLG